MAYTKYSLTPANNNATPPDGAPEGMLPSAVNDTMRDMMAQIRDVGDGIRNGTYTMTAPVITGGSITGASGSFTSLTDSGNLTFTGTGNRITGDFSNATVANRVAFQTSTANSNTILSVLPIGTGSGTFTEYYQSGTDPANSSVLSVGLAGGAGVTRINSTITGTGTYLPLTINTGGSERLRIDTSGNVGIGTSSPNGTLDVNATTPRVVMSISGTAKGQMNIAGSAMNFTANDATFPMTFNTGGGERMRIDSSGNLGLGVTPSAWGSTYKAQQIGQVGVLAGHSSVPAFTLASNAYENSGWKAITTNPAQRIDLSSDNNATIFYRAASVTAGSALSWSESMRIDSSGNVGIGTNNPTNLLVVKGTNAVINLENTGLYNFNFAGTATGGEIVQDSNYPILFKTLNTERMRITSSGGLLVGKTTAGSANAGMEYESAGGALVITRASDVPFIVNRLTNDGTLIRFLQDTVEEGSISVSGNTVSYNGGHLSRWSQLPSNQKDDSILKGTVMSNLDDMCVWTKDGEVLPNEQLNKMKVSDVEGDTNVAGVFVNWTRDEDCNSDDMNVAMTGDMIIRIADGVVVQKGDLLMSAGDGTAKPQGDDIVRSKTIAKVTSNHVTCTYEDGSYCVPCVLMAC